MKKNRILHLGLLVLVLALVTTSLVSGTLAKYVTSLDATGVVTVARWAVKLNGSETTKTTMFSVSHTDENAENSKVAPGTSGTFNLSYQTLGTEVVHSIYITLSNADNMSTELPYLKFYADEAHTKEITLGTPVEVNAAAPIGGVAETTMPIYWVWPFDNSNDAADTDDGVAAKSYNMVATLTVTQID